jgi:tetratricopeptide (TPR) repeat protein
VGAVIFATSACFAADRAGAEAAVARGHAARNLHHDREGLRCFRLAMQLDPTWWEPYFRAGNTLLTLDNEVGAIKMIDQGVKLDPNHGELYFTRARAYFDLGQRAKAEADFNQAIQLTPNDPNFFIKRGDFYFAQSDFNKALKDYTRTIEFSTPAKNASESDKAQTEPLLARAYKDRGNVLMKLAKYNEAVADYTSALENKHLEFPRERILADRAQCYDKLGKHQLAEADRKTASVSSGGILHDMFR